MLDQVVKEFKKDKHYKWDYELQYDLCVMIGTIVMFINTIFVLSIFFIMIMFVSFIFMDSVTIIDFGKSLVICILLGIVSKLARYQIAIFYNGNMVYNNIMVKKYTTICNQINQICLEDVLTTNSLINTRNKKQLIYLSKVFCIINLNLNKPLFSGYVDKVEFHELRVKATKAQQIITDYLILLQKT
jgi:hypothetical protein